MSETKHYEVWVHALGPDNTVYSNFALVPEEMLEQYPHFILEGLCAYVEKRVGVYGIWWGEKREPKPWSSPTSTYPSPT